MDDRQLQWVQKNRTRRRIPTMIGNDVSKVLKSPQVAGSAMQRRVASILQEHAGADLLDHAVVGGVDKGILTLYVENAAVLYQLRLQWEQKLLRLMQTQMPGSGIHEIRFTTNMPR
ncbi:MAG: DciA family protein [Planctomycetota bacterium]